MADYAQAADGRHKLNKQIGARCRQARVASGLTQEKLAERLDVSTQYISDMERGVVGLSLVTLTDLSEQLSVSTDYLLKETSDDDSNRIQVGARTLHLSDSEYELLEKIINTTLQAFRINEEMNSPPKQTAADP
jgi:transcriptional regulator with XRE-family HTH domain